MRLTEVCAHPLVGLLLGTGVRTVLDQACAVQGLRAVVALEASAPGAVLELAARGLGVAVLSASMVRPGEGPLHRVAISDVEDRAVLALAWRSNPDPALRALLEYCRAAFTGGLGR